MSAPAPRKTGLTSFWASAAVGCSVLVTAADATILEATRGGFSNGFGSVLLDTLGLRARYAATAMLVNGFVILACWTVLAPLFARITVRPGRVLTLCVFSVLCAAAWADVLMYEIHATIGALVTPGVVMELAGGRVDSFNEASAIATAVLGTGAAASLIGLFLAVRLGDRVLYAVDPARLAPPRGRMLLGGTAALALAGTAALSSTSESAAEVREALHLQTAANLLTQAVNTATDVDFDGTGWLSRPTDAAPFDAAIHPFAIDLPANGIDEDQLAGDLPATATAPRSTPVPDPASAAGRRPHVLIVYLESFRFDLLATQVDGRAVTPFLSALATEGASRPGSMISPLAATAPHTSRDRTTRSATARPCSAPSEPIVSTMRETTKRDARLVRPQPRAFRFRGSCYCSAFRLSSPKCAGTNRSFSTSTSSTRITPITTMASTPSSTTSRSTVRASGPRTAMRSGRPT